MIMCLRINTRTISINRYRYIIKSISAYISINITIIHLTITHFAHFALFPPFTLFPFFALAFDFGFTLGFVLLLLGLETSFSFLVSLTFFIFLDFNDFLGSAFFTSVVSGAFAFDFDLDFIY